MHSHTHNKHKKPTLPSGSSTPASSPSHCPGGSSAFRTVWSFPVYCLDFVCLWICVCACACECACEAYESKRSKWHNLSSLSRSTHKHTSTHIKKCPTPPKKHPPTQCHGCPIHLQKVPEAHAQRRRRRRRRRHHPLPLPFLFPLLARLAARSRSSRGLGGGFGGLGLLLLGR